MSAKIDLSAAPHFGSMTQGGGLAALFDASAASAAWAESGEGWGGASLPGPQRIDSVVVTSPSNGFDASGQTSQIELLLFARLGAAPTSIFDGQLLARTNYFADINQVRSVTLVPSDTATAWDHVWIVIRSGVWAVATDIAVYGSAASSPPQWPDVVVLDADIAVVERRCDIARPLTRIESYLPEFETILDVRRPSILLVDFRLEAIHNGRVTAIGVGAGVAYQLAADLAGLEAAPVETPANLTGGTNIYDIMDHYGCIVTNGSIKFEVAQFCRLRAFGTAHRSGEIVDGLASVLVEGGKGRNLLRLTHLPLAL